MSLQDKVILITGASSGIGKACAQRLYQEGARIVINYRNDASSANALVDSFGADRAIAVQADAANIDDIDRLVQAAVDKFGRIDTVVANAGLMLMRDVEDTTEDDFAKSFDLNVKGPYFLAQKAVPHMPPGSHIIFISTGVCHHSSVSPKYLLYAATKGAIEQMTRVMAKGLAAKGIIVNAVAPGPTATELFYKGKPEGLVNTIKAWSPFNRLGEPEDIANTVKFLASGDSSWVVGQTVLVNGGIMV
ncbi:short-chain dehydrogenase [Trichoderma gamsii]|uniref:Short-chain dehydrogenase n=1 Tax=Trichoderma gamsii TaxID=398673 RepID=A0A2P4ZS49_9HYPO|nr:short-chain dehydrogenase [Trichoderma gamsii]PON27120.1 short-chain dehydrogenase [Trichoderma gamsii]